MKLVLTVLRWSVIGALTSAVFMALYRYYTLRRPASRSYRSLSKP